MNIFRKKRKSTSPKMTGANLNNQKKETVISPREEYALRFEHRDGWNHETAMAALRKAKRKYGISAKEFVQYKYYDCDESEYEKKHEAYLAQKEEFLRLIEEEQNAKTKLFIKKVSDETEWSLEEAESAMEEAYFRTGMIYEYYSAYRFWSFSNKEQEGFFTRTYADALREKYTTKQIIRIMANKDLFCKYFDEFLGRKWMRSEDADVETFCNRFNGSGGVIYKPYSFGAGKGIEIFDFKNKSMVDAFNEIAQKQPGIVEEVVVQHSQMKLLSPASVNTIRIVTIFTNNPDAGIECGKVHILYAAIRMGTGDSCTDNMHTGGLAAAVDKETGIIVTDAVDSNLNTYDKHPDTGTDIRGFQIPMYSSVKKLVVEAASKYEGYFGWDIAVTENGPVIIECNTKPDDALLQMPYVPARMGMKKVIEDYL